MVGVTEFYLVNWLGTWNVRRINGIAKREEVVDVFRKGKFELLALTETKLKENDVNGIIAGVQEIERARESVAVLMKEEWYNGVIGFGYVISRILWVKFKFSKECKVE